jgi:GSH-dependent disulfide-bond oxidoreductase
VIDLYGMGSPNVLKILIMLEEIGQPYRLHHVDVIRGEGKHPSFLALNPLGKVPVILDDNEAGETSPIFESGVILMYLAENYGPELLPAAGSARWNILKWLFAQVAYAGPMLGQLNHFQLVAGQADTYGGRRYRDIARKVYQDFESRLEAQPWLGGQSFSIADIAMYPWAAYLERHTTDPQSFPHLLQWRRKIDARPAVQTAVRAFGSKLAGATANATLPSDEDFDRFFGRSEAGPAPDFVRYQSLGAFTSLKRD